MPPVDYFTIIHRYIQPDSALYKVYIPHVSLVTAKALGIAKRLGLSRERQRFIEEAAMLHDIGVVRVQEYATSPESEGLPYICHVIAGREILEQEGLPRHARVAARHIGVGILKQEILARHLPLPPCDFVAESLEERIISWADLFFSKTPKKLWQEQSLEDVQAKIERFGPRHARVFQAWSAEFGQGE